MADAYSFAAAGSAQHRGYDVGAVASPNAPWVAPGGGQMDENGVATRRHVEQVIDRLEELIDAESAALRSRTKLDLKDFNNRKSLGLLELSRAMRHYDGASLDAAIRARLGGLRAKLESNRALLKMHVEAVREISSIVADTIRNAESDGTYSVSIRSSQKRS